MRKHYKIKKFSCGLCKPYKKGMSNRWSAKEFSLLREFEREKVILAKNGIFAKILA